MKKANIKKTMFAAVALILTVVLAACNLSKRGPLANPSDYTFAVGDFLSLKEAYEIGLLEDADLESIELNRYSNGLSCSNGGGDPVDGTQDNRFEEIQGILIDGWAKFLIEKYNYSGTSDGFSTREFCGVYNGLAVVMMSDSFIGYVQALSQETIGSVTFAYNDGQTLYACVVDESALLWNKAWESISFYGENTSSVEQGCKKFSLENSISSWYVGYHDGFVYIMDGAGISRIRPDGSDKQSMGIRYFTEAMIHDGFLYYIEGGFNMYTGMPVDPLRRVRLDGTGDMVYTNTVETKTIRTGGLEGAPDPYTTTFGVMSFKGFGKWIYYLSGVSIRDLSLYRISIDGTGKQLIANNCRDFEIFDRQLFVSSYIDKLQDHTKITRYDLHGGNEVVLEQNSGSTQSILFEHEDFLYYQDYVLSSPDPANSINICRMRLDGSDKKVIAEGISNFVALNNNKIYFTKSALRNGSTWDRKQLLYEIGVDDPSNAKLLYDDIYIENIAGDAVFFITIEYFPLNSGKGNLIILFRLSLLNGSVVEVYNNNSDEYYAGHFIHDNKLYVVVK